MKQKTHLMVALLVMALTSLSSIFGPGNHQNGKHPCKKSQIAGIPIPISFGGEFISKVVDFPDHFPLPQSLGHQT